MVNIQQNSKRITVGKDIDLVADAEDHRKSKYTDESNGSSRGGSSNSSNSQSNSLVVNKYNRHSSLCMNDVEQKTFETVLSCGYLYFNMHSRYKHTQTHTHTHTHTQ